MELQYDIYRVLAESTASYQERVEMLNSAPRAFMNPDAPGYIGGCLVRWKGGRYGEGASITLQRSLSRPQARDWCLAHREVLIEEAVAIKWEDGVTTPLIREDELPMVAQVAAYIRQFPQLRFANKTAEMWISGSSNQLIWENFTPETCSSEAVDASCSTGYEDQPVSHYNFHRPESVLRTRCTRDTIDVVGMYALEWALNLDLAKILGKEKKDFSIREILLPLERRVAELGWEPATAS